MAYPVFTWKPLTDPEGSLSDQNIETQFGNGYTQSTGDGINTIRQIWPLKFEGQKADMEPIVNFIRDRQGRELFEWETPMGETGLFVAKDLKVRVGHWEVWRVSVTFEQRYAP